MIYAIIIICSLEVGCYQKNEATGYALLSQCQQKIKEAEKQISKDIKEGDLPPDTWITLKACRKKNSTQDITGEDA